MEESRKIWRQKRKEDGFCLQCGKQRDSHKSKIYCKSCSDKFKLKSKLRHEKMMSLSLCTCCGKFPLKSKKLCQFCLEKFKNNRKLRDEIRKNDKLCFVCGKNEPIDNHKICETCCIKRAASHNLKDTSKWTELFDLLKKQNYLCPFTGRKLIIGINAELDHIIPRAKGGEDKIENMQWVCAEINKMKLDHFTEDFLSLVVEVYKYKKLN